MSQNIESQLNNEKNEIITVRFHIKKNIYQFDQAIRNKDTTFG